MTIEIATEDTQLEAAAPIPVAVEDISREVTKAVKVAKDAKESAETREETDDGAPSPRSAALSADMKALRAAEDKSLKDIIDGFGDHTAYKIRITRKEPQTVKDRATGKVIPTGGFLEWVEGQPIDESWLQNHYGGGKYELFFRKRGIKGGWEYGGQVTVPIAGEPDLRALPGAERDTPPTAMVTTSGENPTMAKAALDIMSESLKRAEDRADRGNSHHDSPIIEMMREQLRARDAELAAMRLEIREAMKPQPTSEDKFKDKFLDRLMDGDSARVTSVRAALESEVRQVKEAAIENEKRLYDRFERDRQDMRNAHERELALLRSSADAQIAAAKASYDIQLASAKSSFDTQKEIMAAENRRLDRDNTELRDEVKELRAKKDKSLVETARELETVKEALGLGDGDDKGIGEKFADMLTNPEAISAIGKIVRGDSPPVAAPAAAAAVERPRRRVIRDKTDGHKYIVNPDGTRQGPLPEKPPQRAAPQPEGPPPIDPGTLQQMVVLLENAYSNGTDPDTVARTAKPHVSDQVLMLIREVGGVDAFLSKVAKLPGSSPLLSTQAGRNWVRKVGKGLVGDE